MSDPAKRQFTVEYDSGVAAAERLLPDRKETWTLDGGRASYHDRDNFVTNRVTLADYQDTNLGAASVMGLSTAWACVRLVAGTISSLPLMVYRNGTTGREVAFDHPLYRILHDSPNADQTSLNFWQFMSAAVELQGNAFAEVKRRSGGVVTSLAPPFAPDNVKVRRLDSGALEYEFLELGASRKLRQDQVLHIRGFGGNPLGGLSTLSFGRQTFGIAMAIERAAAATFRNGVRPSGILQTDMQMDREQRAEAERLLQEKYQGTMNAGLPMLLDRGVKWQSVNINPEDAQMLQSRAFSVEEICRFFQVPPHMVGHTEKTTSWGTGIEQMTIGFVQYTLRERLKNIESALEKQLLTEVERQAGMRIEFNIDGLLRGDTASRFASYATGLQNGIYTINEVRAKENMPPVEGGDLPRMQMQNVPITEAGQLPAPSGE